MSSGMLLLAGLFATGPVSECPIETAPMPRARNGSVQVEFRVHLTPHGLSLGAGAGRVKPVEPPRIVVPPLSANPVPAPIASPPPEVRAMMLQAIGQTGSPVENPFAPPRCMPPAPPVLLSLPHEPPVVLRSEAPLPFGVWTRELGPVAYRIELKDTTLTITTTLSETDASGKVCTIDHVLTADWYPTRNAGEIVGIVSGFDFKTVGKSMPLDVVPAVLGTLVDLQKQMNGKPIALKLRPTDDGLSISDVRLPQLNDYADLAIALQAVGGSYKPVRNAAATSQIITVSGTMLPGTQHFQQNLLFVPERGSLPPMPLPMPLPRSNPFRNGGW